MSQMEKSVTEKVLSIENMVVSFKVKGGVRLNAVSGVSFSISEGETLGLVGESGCGKTTTGRAIVGLNSLASGSIHFRGREISKLSKKENFDFRSRVQMIFQDPFSSLDPRMTVLSIIEEGLLIHRSMKKDERKNRVFELLEKVGLEKEHAGRFPHEFSGGQRQRIGIARALALNPEFIVCDEPVSALDVSVQAQIMNLLLKLQKENNLTYLFIAHDLAVVRHISDRIAVMYLGKVMESGSRDEIFENPLHPYTEALIEAIPVPDPERKKHPKIIRGELPSPINPPSGCRFHTRCPQIMEICSQIQPIWKEYSAGHFAACHLLGKR